MPLKYLVAAESVRGFEGGNLGNVPDAALGSRTRRERKGDRWRDRRTPVPRRLADRKGHLSSMGAEGERWGRPEPPWPLCWSAW